MPPIDLKTRIDADAKIIVSLLEAIAGDLTDVRDSLQELTARVADIEMRFEEHEKKHTVW